ncbi:MAG: hypothetical protein DDT31_00624 [Syntrophomonadaceae bacterium]|nr:hypothetical protein [Bacillota bacterium]
MYYTLEKDLLGWNVVDRDNNCKVVKGPFNNEYLACAALYELLLALAHESRKT